MKLHSVSNAVTASSYEVYTYQDDCLVIVRDLLQNLLDALGSNYSVDALFAFYLAPVDQDDLEHTYNEEDYRKIALGQLPEPNDLRLLRFRENVGSQLYIFAKDALEGKLHDAARSIMQLIQYDPVVKTTYC